MTPLHLAGIAILVAILLLAGCSRIGIPQPGKITITDER